MQGFVLALQLSDRQSRFVASLSSSGKSSVDGDRLQSPRFPRGSDVDIAACVGKIADYLPIEQI